MTTVSMHEAKTHLSALIAEIERTGEPVVISRHGRAVAQIAAAGRGSRIHPDDFLRTIQIREDPTLPTIEEWEDA